MKNIKVIASAALIGMVLMFMGSCYYDEVLPEDLKVQDDGALTDAKFSTDILPIFNSSCSAAGCHNTGGTPPDLTPAKAYDALIGGGYIDTAVPENSGLYQWMKGNKGIPMPITGANPAYNAKVLAWIKQGAQNN
ncbi:MAG: hypothetical protein K9J37_18790 [Saprospiraceae bacterium]|nr:hypothetical protein [Saprospiraceae bacterium]MCF8251970.1 hypothetical protein [Saprospiraceae bacterium]MCF8282779.1 hypothetical protein [Bacteroidales bacterium]MCF8313626.1 hypothetical protein [Saprospiraceae bacterium]MCF8442333.1 hypothetical protein [Saprospiraceae bacterium]